MTFSIGHTLVTPLPDGRVSYTPCRHCGEECRGHSMAGRMEAPGSAIRPLCRTCGAMCAPAQCDACRADGAASGREEERAAVVAYAREWADEMNETARKLGDNTERERRHAAGYVLTNLANAIERGEHR